MSEAAAVTGACVPAASLCCPTLCIDTMSLKERSATLLSALHRMA